MMAGIVAPGVTTAETLAFEHIDALLPEELTALGAAAEKRTREFAAGRSCARQALAALGVPAVPILRGSRRQPLWPEGVVGSITHCAGYCAAAAARRDRFLSIGLDAEPHAPLPEPIVKRVALPAEREWLHAQGQSPIAWDKVLFSAKESIYKAWFPLTGRWLGFEDASVSFDPDGGTFQARLVTPLEMSDGRRIDRFDGRMYVAFGFVLTFVSIPVPANHA
jgi:4'-phosphopantetheinyl transferase EntD